MVAKVLYFVIAVQIEVLTAVEVRVFWICILNTVLIEIGPSSIDDSFEIFAVLGPCNLQISSVTDSQDVAPAVLEIVSLCVVIKCQVSEVSSKLGHRNRVECHCLIPVVSVAVTRVT